MKYQKLPLILIFLFVCLVVAEGQAKRGAIRVEVASQKPFLLHVTIISGSHKPISIERGSLPWATRYGMVLTAITARGESLEKVLPVEDPPAGEMTVKPYQTLSGNVDLEGIFKGLDIA